MKEEILTHLNDPRQLEKLYRANKLPFKRAFTMLYPQLKGNVLADFWNERLNYETDEASHSTPSDLFFVIIASLIAGFIAKIPALFNINDQFFYPRNIGFIIFPVLAAYFAWKNKLSAGKIGLIFILTIAPLVFINALPNVTGNDTLNICCIHLLLFLWFIFGFSFVGQAENDTEKRLAFLKYNGDLVVITTLIVIAAGIMSGITVGLFSLIGLYIEEFYFKNVVIFSLPAAPILGNYLIHSNPQLVGRVSPVIAKIFSPLVLVMLVIYLVAMAYAGKSPYNDREFLLTFNALLVGVMAIIFFSVSETSKTKVEVWILFLLSLVTVIVNAIALSAIIFRISQWGFSPNRAAIIGGDILIFINLLLVTMQLFRMIINKGDISGVRKVIAYYLPVYFIWSIIATFVFPYIFGFW